MEADIRHIWVEILPVQALYPRLTHGYITLYQTTLQSLSCLVFLESTAMENNS